MEEANTAQNDLRGGRSPWLAGLTRPHHPVLEQNLRCDVLIVGGGITGSLLAEHLSRRGLQICLIDRERPGFGSTAASTAMLQWEIDCSLAELTGFYGFEKASGIYRRSLQAVSGLKSLVDTLGLGCAFRDRHTLYLAGGEIGATELRAEYELRARAGLPGTYLDYLTLLREFGFTREAAIVSSGSADADPLLLSHALLAQAASQGARIADAQAVHYDPAGRSVIVGLENGCEIEADHVVLATGYVMPDFLKTDLHQTASSWAIATVPQAPGALWRDGVLIWEASEDYLYARTTQDNRIVIGGEDDDSITDPEDRDALMPAKTEILLKKLAALCPQAIASADFVWSGAFGETQDGLPLIGPVPDHPRLFAAYGYGGNGITFSFLASRLIGRMIAGEREAWFDDFAIDRPVPKLLG
ncbi:MAG: FAD-binding oxidoreductase [Alphaproteobacteria bacterium]|nr:FAD-binding oxidoreductase [Alphaproteobacteria bacterium]MBU0797154.1 FAD-binding oxidoreductase [Alphaproteobacteria bacterium]MBU0887175.1 FAD-binding oxidoreductase [Alphaproteobacteria bacterium]MBU1814425.1 FAD-binding oxidoreductase [Alphaproteobacteria bacterium]MBU2089089.1 FAD-binding oxidoreductase [Alphaproteobacteria bacterium]